METPRPHRIKLPNRLRFSCILASRRACPGGAYLLAVLLPAIASAQLSAEQNAATSVAAIERMLVETIARVEPSVIAISRSAPAQSPPTADDPFGEFRPPDVSDAPWSTTGAGVIIDRAGLVLTQYLAVSEDEDHTVVTTDGKRYPASIQGADPRSGLAVLKIQPTASPLQRAGDGRNATPPSYPAIRFGDASTLRKGQFVVVIGNPFAIITDGQATASWGTVTNFARKAPVGTNLNDAPGPANDYRTTLHHLGTLIQTDARLGWSAGGGALVNLRGELVGLTTSVATIAGHEQPAGYAIPINGAMRRIIDTLKQGREVEYGMLGIGFSPTLVESTAGRGGPLRAAQVYPGSPAARAGLQVGDVITRIDERPVADIDAVQLAVSTLPPATETTVEYQRDGRPAIAKVTLAKLAVAGKKVVSERPKAWRGIRADYATALDAAELSQAISSGAFDPEGCVLAVDVEPQSPAWLAGVRPGMFISHVDGKRVSTPDEFRAAARTLPADKFDITLTQPIDQLSP